VGTSIWPRVPHKKKARKKCPHYDKRMYIAHNSVRFFFGAGSSFSYPREFWIKG
jgi:hypothetical protein